MTRTNFRVNLQIAIGIGCLLFARWYSVAGACAVFAILMAVDEKEL